MINWLCLVLFFTSSYDRMIAITVDIEFMRFLLWRIGILWLIHKYLDYYTNYG